MERILKYSHPSVPKEGVELDKRYHLEELQSKFKLEYIKAFFTPENFSWNELETTTKK